MPMDGEDSSKRFRIEIDGEEYVVRGSSTSEHVAEIGRMINQKIEAIRSAQPNLPRHRVGMLVAINLADELYALRKENQELLDVLEEAR